MLGFGLLGFELMGRLHYHYLGVHGQTLREFPGGSVALLVLSLPVAVAILLRVRPLPALVLLLALISWAAPWLYAWNKASYGWQALAIDELSAGLESCSAITMRWHDSSVFLPRNAFATVGSRLQCRYRTILTTDNVREIWHIERRAQDTPATAASGAAVRGQDIPATAASSEEVRAQDTPLVTAASSQPENQVHENLLVATADPGLLIPDEDISELSALLYEAGYTLLLRLPASVVYGRFVAVNPAPHDLELPLDYFPSDSPWLAHKLQEAPHAFATAAGIFRLEDGQLLRYEFADTAPIQLQDTVTNATGWFNYGPAGFTRAIEFGNAIPGSTPQP